MRWFRFRHFSSRLLFLMAGLLAVVQAIVYLLVARANERNARTHISQNLEVGARVFRDAVDQRRADLTRSAGLLQTDYAFRQVLLQDPLDQATLRSLLHSFVTRINAHSVAYFDAAANLQAATRENLSAAEVAPFRELIDRAIDRDPQEASGFAYFDGRLCVLVVVPLYAPFPQIYGWFGLVYEIDDEFARKIKDTTLLEVTFSSSPGGADDRVLATTLAPNQAGAVAHEAMMTNDRGTQVVHVDGEPYVTTFQPLTLLGSAPARIALQRSLTAELAPARSLENVMLLVSLAALALATLAALWFARSLSQPVRQLAAQTKRVGAGDYTARLDLDRADELGQLATDFNAMTRGLEERDRIRDLLDKNVSPEVAAQLLRTGTALGGEEREVTVLFADLRGFTPLSESLAPRDLIGLLNRHLDRMSGVIERQGGVIDKFIGDEIMALFGAPVAQPDDADRALRAALAMQQALRELNAELQAEGRPDLALGVGINTARVIAGNIGSHRRLNYSVIGDGVNVAARLQTLTRTAEYRATILASAATLAAARSTYATRALGTVTVKGRREPVDIFAVDGIQHIGGQVAVAPR
ncbi:MAG TPA: adenylate/guanylate cyclase domain-containing protein [Opitutus sp.]|nr:adenylate/guanylate cyclase domain-containing protein [Opitutus sp.]